MPVESPSASLLAASLPLPSFAPLARPDRLQCCLCTRSRLRAGAAERSRIGHSPLQRPSHPKRPACVCVGTQPRPPRPRLRNLQAMYNRGAGTWCCSAPAGRCMSAASLLMRDLFLVPRPARHRCAADAAVRNQRFLMRACKRCVGAAAACRPRMALLTRTRPRCELPVVPQLSAHPRRNELHPAGVWRRCWGVFFGCLQRARHRNVAHHDRVCPRYAPAAAKVRQQSCLRRGLMHCTPSAHSPRARASHMDNRPQQAHHPFRAHGGGRRRHEVCAGGCHGHWSVNVLSVMPDVAAYWPGAPAGA